MKTAFEHDTIAAISTAVSESGIGIIRISGPDAVNVADKVYRSPGGKKKLKDAASHTIHYGYIVDPDAESRMEKSGKGIPGLVDEVLVSIMLAPKTYTAEDVVEINCHGGVLAVTKVLQAVISAGARPAEPGEFTKRAFLNGRIDLTEAEAVMDVIQSKNQYALSNSVGQVKGSLHDKIEQIRSDMLYQSAHIEACLDDPEALSYNEYLPELDQSCQSWTGEVAHLLSTADCGRMMQEGIRTVIVGKPNAGKSSLMNLLVGEDRAIVTPIAGTTRDVLTETITIGGITLVITDTAGIHDTEDLVEKIGVSKAKDSVKQADLVLFMVDSSTDLEEADLEILNMIRDKKIIVLQNKTDLETKTNIDDIQYEIRKIVGQPDGNEIPVIPFSAKDRTGIDRLTDTLKEMFFSGKISFNDEIVIANARHKVLLQKTLDSLRQLKKSIDMQMPEDFYTIDLMSAYESLGEITGQEIGDDLADEIFSRFCMGK